ncbi:MAG: hypothetical protein IH936_04310 [Acidobacteria bacterium]|nr:hypothetical protein [Acidobacteriota bacterium]
MSAFVCILDRSGASLDRREILQLAESLERYGGTLSSVCRGPVAIAVRHMGSATSRDRFGPVTDPKTGVVVALSGRFSFVEEKLVPASASSALDPFAHQDASFFAGTSGSFVAIAADPRRRWLSIVRDHLGDLKVYYYLDRRWLIAASEPAAILRHAAVADDLDESSAARFLGFRFSQTERSFFRDIKELPPAHRLTVTAGDSGAKRYWSFRLHRGAHKRSREQVHAEFRSHLRRSVADQMAELETCQVGLSLSGGLDSTTLAALVPPGVQVFSWYFDDLLECDERSNIEAVAEHLKRRVHWVNGDGLYPLCGDYVDRFVHENSPYLNAFAALKCRLYRVARANGCERIMVGDAGDALFSAKEYWLRDALAGGRPRALASLATTIRDALRGDRFARLALRRLLPMPGVREVIRGPRRLPWLTETANGLLPKAALSPILPDVRQRHRYDRIVGAKHTELESEERRLFAQCGVGRSNPFWYWPLLEMVINLPACWYYNDGRSKVLTREAMKGLLPERVLESGRVGLLGTFFLRGIESKRNELRESVFRHPRSDWQRYVNRSWLEPYLSASESIRFGHTILWRVISYELWYRRLIRSS